MKRSLLIIGFFISILSFAQDDSTVVDITAEIDSAAKKEMQEPEPTKVFYSQRLINAKTVEVLHKGIMEFQVLHNFGDIAGANGGISKFFGLDVAADIKIGFQVGLGNRLNILAARTKGCGDVQQLWELGLKYQLMRQMENDPKHPLSMTLYTNWVISSQKSNPDPLKEYHYEDFTDRMSQLIQLMIARRFGNFSFQLSPTYVHTNRVVPGDQNSIFALGTAMRIPLTKKVFIITDYFINFRNDESEAVLKSQGINLYNAFGAGIEILTEGHVFHLNFTNANNLLENRFIPRTLSSWGKGQYRWGFTIARRFVLFTDKKNQ
jgi:hypothetical protein